MLDKEVPYDKIPVKDLPEYHKAEEKEWEDWLNNKSVKVITGKEAENIRKTVDFINESIVYLRFVDINNFNS